MGIAAYNRGSRAISRQIDEELKGSNAGVCIVHPIAEPKPKPDKGVLGYWSLPDDPELVKIGDRVYCTVTQAKGWSVVTAVKGDRRDLRIKTDLYERRWAYAHNFTKEPPEWMLR